MNKDPIKCVNCGKFISYDDIENKRVQFEHIPDSHFTVEENNFTCKRCIEREIKK